MAPHWPEEVDVFSEPHSRMKKLVHKYSKMVSSTDFSDEYHMKTLLQNLINVFCEFKAHEDIENILIMRTLKRKLKAACVTSAAVCNCHSDNRLTDMLEMVVHGSRSRWTDKSIKERQSFGHKLQKALEEFTTKFIPHMEEEEEVRKYYTEGLYVFQPMLMQYFSYEELKELKARVIQEHLLPTNQEKFVEDLYQRDELPDVKTEPELCYFDRLPDEICEKVFSYLSPQDLCRSAQTCHRWNGLTKDPALWTGIYPVHWALGNWTFHPEPLGGVDGVGEFDDDFVGEFDDPPLVVSCQDEDADVDESSSYHSDEDDMKGYYGDEEPNSRILTEVKVLSSLVKYLLPRVGSGVKVVDLAYSKGLSSSLVHKILKLCPNMEVLDLTHTQVGDAAFHEYGVSNRQSKLRHLDLTNCHNITDQTLYSLIGASVNGIIHKDEDDTNDNDFGGREKESDIENRPMCCQNRKNMTCASGLLNKTPLTVTSNINYGETKTNIGCCGNRLNKVEPYTNNVIDQACHRIPDSSSCRCDSSTKNEICDCQGCSSVVNNDYSRQDYYSCSDTIQGQCGVGAVTGSSSNTVQFCGSASSSLDTPSCSAASTELEIGSMCVKDCPFLSATNTNNISRHVGVAYSPDSQHSCTETHQNDHNTTIDDDKEEDEEDGSMFPATNNLRSNRPLSHLEFLSLNGCYLISDVGLRVLSLGGGTPCLGHLDLSGCVGLTGPSVQQLVLTCGQQLDHANLFYCDNLPLDPYPQTASGCRNRGCDTRFCCSAD